MALIVEDGTNVSGADAFVTLAYVDDYYDAHDGGDKWNKSDEKKEQAIRRATAYLSEGFTWMGQRTHGRNQSLTWPRIGVYDAERWNILSDQIPEELMKACAELAIRELNDPNGINPEFTQSEAVKREKVGELEVEYATVSNSVGDARPVLAIVQDLIGQFLDSGASASKGGLFGETIRV